MKQTKLFAAVFSILSFVTIVPARLMAAPAGPGDGSDPFATPVNGGLVVVVVIAFLFGIYRIFKLNKQNQGYKQ